jgi:hypothetical protein
LNQVEDRSIESWRAGFIEEVTAANNTIPVQTSTGFYATFEFLEHWVWIMRNLRVLIG